MPDARLGYTRTNRTETIAGRNQTWLDGSPEVQNLRASIHLVSSDSRRHGVLVLDPITEPEFEAIAQSGGALPTKELRLPSEACEVSDQDGGDLSVGTVSEESLQRASGWANIGERVADGQAVLAGVRAAPRFLPAARSFSAGFPDAVLHIVDAAGQSPGAAVHAAEMGSMGRFSDR